MGAIITILLVILGIMIIFAIIEALFWLAAIALAAIGAVLLWRRISPKTTPT